MNKAPSSPVGRVVVVGRGATAEQIGSGLAARAETVHQGVPTEHSRRGYEAMFETAATQFGGLDLVVFAHADDRAQSSTFLADMSEQHWIAACESTLDAAYRCSQAAHRHLMSSGGQLVFVVPTIALTGAAGFTAYSAAAEGIRGLAKGVAKTWGRDGVRVNTVAVGFDGFADNEAMSLVPPALGPADLARDVAPVIALLSSADAHFVTGTTLVLDGGIWTAL